MKGTTSWVRYQSKSLCRTALEIRQRRLGAKHADVTASQRMLANILHAKGDSVEAARLLRDVLAQ